MTESTMSTDGDSLIGLEVWYPYDFCTKRLGKVIRENLDRDVVWIEDLEDDSPEKQIWWGRASSVEIAEDDD